MSPRGFPTGAFALLIGILLLGMQPAAASAPRESRPGHLLPNTPPSLSGDEAVGYQLDAAHDGNQPGDPIGPPLTKLWSVSLGSAVSYP